jgi:hypothetical protein
LLCNNVLDTPLKSGRVKSTLNLEIAFHGQPGTFLEDFFGQGFVSLDTVFHVQQPWLSDQSVISWLFLSFKPLVERCYQKGATELIILAKYPVRAVI